MLNCDVESVMKDGTVLVNPESYSLPPYSAETRGIHEAYLKAMRESNDPHTENIHTKRTRKTAVTTRQA